MSQLPFSLIKQIFDESVDEGTICPVCEKFSKEYKRKLNSGMAWSLIMIYRLSNKNFEYIHVQNEFKKRFDLNAIRREYPKLEHWGLIRRKKGVDPSQNSRTGYFQLTPKGILFVEGKIKVKERVHLLHGKIKEFSGDLIDIKQALKNKFDYQ